MDLASVVPLEIVSCSSQELLSPSKGLNSAACVPLLRSLLDSGGGGDAGWRAEKFCEYPQQLVFRVCRPMGQLVRSLVVVSNPTLIAHRVEIFLSSTDTSEWRTAAFDRVGFISFQGPQDTQCAAAQELKSVPLHSSTTRRLMFIKLLVHTCHVHRGNLFNQVGLACVVALSDSADEDANMSSLVEIVRQRVEEEKFPLITNESLVEFPPWPVMDTKRQTRGSPTTSIATCSSERNNYTTPAELLVRIQLARERHSLIVPATVSSESDAKLFLVQKRQWAMHEYECFELSERFEELHAREFVARSALDDRLATRSQREELQHALRELDKCVHAREAVLQQSVNVALARQLANSPVKNARSTLKQSVVRSKDSWTTLERWQAREEYLWKVYEGVAKPSELSAANSTCAIEALNEIVQIATTGLRDVDAQVFIAATTLLWWVLPRHPRFQDYCGWKDEISALVSTLATRLDDIQPAVRTNAAYSLIKVAELTRARGTFVMHTLLQLAEKKRAIHVTDQTLYGLLKVFSALLLAFHCCAALDISAKRVLTFLLAHDALVHANGHVREAARQLMLVLSEEVGSEEIVAYVNERNALPDERNDQLIN